MIIASIVFAVIGLLFVLGAFALNGEGWMIAIGIVLFIATGGFLIAAIVQDAKKEREAFMTECMQYRKRYECTALWRAGESRTTVTPVVVPVR